MAVRNPTGADYGRTFNIDTGRGTLEVMDPDTLASFLYSRNGRDVSFVDVAFNNVTILSNPWTSTADASATAFAQDATIAGGAVKGVTGATGEGAMSLFGAPIFQPQLNCGMEVSLKVSAITNIRLEVGWVNVITDKTLPVATDVDGTPTFAANSTEVAIMSWQTDDTIATPRFVGDSVDFPTAKGATLMTPYGVPAASQTAWAPTADTWFSVRVQNYGTRASSDADPTGSVACMIFNDKNQIVAFSMFDAIAGGGTGGLTPEAMLAPWIFGGTINTTSKDVHVRYARAWADRYVN